MANRLDAKITKDKAQYKRIKQYGYLNQDAINLLNENNKKKIKGNSWHPIKFRLNILFIKNPQVKQTIYIGSV